MIATKDLLEIIGHIKERFPGISRITTYARAKAMARKGHDEYKELKEAGLTRIHTGMESGSAAVLKMVQKGSRPRDIVDGGRKVMEAGISLSEYIMPGLGGKTLSEEHARETARLLNTIKPDFIRVRTFAMHPMSPMQKMVEEGTFVPLSDDEIVAEIRLLVSELKEMHSHFRCGDFSLNLLMQVDGYLDRDRDTMLEELDRFLALTKIQRQAYSLLRRSHPAMQYPLEVVKEKEMLSGISQQIEELEQRDEDGFNKYIQQLMTYQLPQPQTDAWTRETHGCTALSDMAKT